MRQSMWVVRVAGVAALAIGSHSVAGWTAGPALPAGKSAPAGVVLGSTIYAMGGAPWMNGSDQDGSVYAFNGSTWYSTAPLDGLGPVIGMGAGVDAQNRIVVFGGVVDGSDPGPNTVYDPSNGPTVSVHARGSSAPKVGFACTTDDAGYVYSLGGGNGASSSNSGYCERYDASANAWEVLPSMPLPVANACAATDEDGNLYVFGGFNANGSARVANVARFDMGTWTWSNTDVPDMPVALSDARAVLGVDHRIYVIGGRTGTGATGTVSAATYVLNLMTNTWSAGPSLGTARASCAAVRLGDTIWVAGGTGAGGVALSSTESLYTPECPVFVQQPESVSAWAGMPIGFGAQAVGGTPLTYQWRRDGQPLVDGAQADGSVVTGSASPSLSIGHPSALDRGVYDVVASTPCGDVPSSGASFTIRPAPTIPPSWDVRLMHPAWADSSRLHAISGGVQVGSVDLPFGVYSAVERPTVWAGTAASAVNITPAGSAGGAVFAAHDGTVAGWWWWPYSCYWQGSMETCYNMEAAAWSGAGWDHQNLQVSGWEYSEVTAVCTSGAQAMVAGYVWTDDFGYDTYTFHAGVWHGSAFVDVQPQGIWRSIIQAGDEAHQYGWTFAEGSTWPHAARWSGTAASWTDLHPAGYDRSLLYGAGDEQQVGVVGPATALHAGVWGSSAGAFRDLHVAGAASSSAVACAGGFQVGSVSYPNAGARATIWAGTPESAFSLHSLLPPTYVASQAEDIEVQSDGSVWVVGTAWGGSPVHAEAVMWVAGVQVLGDLNHDGTVDGTDLGLLLGAWGTADPAADLNHDGTVDGSDLGMLLGAWS